MPYENESAKHQGFLNLSSSMSSMKQLTQGMKVSPAQVKYERIDNIVMDNFIKSENSDLQYLFVIDGSKHESEVATNNTDLGVAFITVDQCAIDFKKMVNYLKNDFATPKEYKEIKQDVVVNMMIPLKGLTREDIPDERDLFRKFVHESFKNANNPIVDYLKDKGHTITKEESILDTYKFLITKIKTSNVNNIQPCICCKKDNKFTSLKKFRTDPERISDVHLCDCEENKKEIYITDFLQFHEQLNSETSDNALTTQIMLVLEKLVMINLLRILEMNNLKEVIEKSAFIMDGSLAVYSHASWLSSAISEFIFDYKDNYKLLLCGFEKTGHFVDRFKKVDSYFVEEPLKKGTLFFLNDDYIKEHIKTYQNDSFYGEKHYFGKKLFYKNHLNRLYVVNLAFEDNADKFKNFNQRHTSEYLNSCQRVEHLLTLLENFTSQAYPNALSFIAMANEGVSLSNSTHGKKIIAELLESIVGIKEESL